MVRNWERWKKTEEGRARVVCDNRSWVALLDMFPKVEGDTLVVSRKPYDDIVDTLELSIEETYDFFEIIRTIARRLRDKLNAEKVYAMSICEHWEEVEIHYADKITSVQFPSCLLRYSSCLSPTLSLKDCEIYLTLFQASFNGQRLPQLFRAIEKNIFFSAEFSDGPKPQKCLRKIYNRLKNRKKRGIAGDIFNPR